MSGWKIYLGLLGAFVVLVILYGLGLAFNLVGRGVNTASKMADQTVFNASGNVMSYDTFLSKYEAYKRYKAQYASAKKKMDVLEAKGITSGNTYDNTYNEMTGAQSMMMSAAQDYNTNSSSYYKKIWKQKGLPERLAVE